MCLFVFVQETLTAIMLVTNAELEKKYKILPNASVANQIIHK